ncbi:MAG: basic secretory family protein [Actinomycetota bacterium]|nr:basic secretory family protein [Actinomycetota bacterium]
MGAHARRRVPGWVVAALVAAVILELVGGGLAARSLLQQRSTTARPVSAAPVPASVAARPAPTTTAVQARRAAVEALLSRRGAAVLAHDRAGFLATVDANSPEFLAGQAALYDNLSGVAFSTWDYQLDAASDHVIPAATDQRLGAEAWLPTVVLRYGLAGFDAQPAQASQYLTFVRRGEAWLVSGDADIDDSGVHTARDLWDFGPVEAQQTATSLVLGHPGSRAARRGLAADIAAAVPRVSAVWGTDWAQKVVVLTPDSQEELTRILGATTDLSQIAAVATAELTRGPAGRTSPVGDRIVVNPVNAAKLSAAGRRVVLTHEVTHVASRAATGQAVPAWLVEGLADYVGYLDSGVSVASAGRELRGDIRAGRLPERLPTDEDFLATNPALSQIYEQAWLACRLIVRRSDQATLVQLYRQVGAAAPGTPGDRALGDAFAALLHTDLASFTGDWRSYLPTELS